ncbi:cell shape-determining protein MreC [Bacteroidia bacterium]|nr:cell shape-determining protein MreC [Bacteroidia bacterium]
MLIRNNEFQRSKYLTVFQEIAGDVYTVSNSVESYMNLKTTNSDLMQKVASLEEELLIYQKKLEILTNLASAHEVRFDTDTLLTYHFIEARVIHNQIFGTENYITLNKGSKDGIEKDMGVVTSKGVVGVIIKASPHFSIVIPILNAKYKVNCRIKSSNYSGPLAWEGGDPRYAYLTELPKHATYDVGDTIVTSGYSTVFPVGIPVGVIEKSQIQQTENYNSLKVKLFTDFATLSEVMVIKNTLKDEQIAIEKGVFN